MKEQCPRCGHIFSITGDPSPNMGFFVDDVELDKHDGEEIAFYLFKGSYKFRRTILCPSCRRLSFGGEEREDSVKIGPEDRFWVVTDPTPVSGLTDILFETSLAGLANQFKGGLTIEHNPTIFTERAEAQIDAMDRLHRKRALDLAPTTRLFSRGEGEGAVGGDATAALKGGRCRDCAYWESAALPESSIRSGWCEHPKLRGTVQPDMEDDELGVIDDENMSGFAFGPTFGCVHFKQRTSDASIGEKDQKRQLGDKVRNLEEPLETHKDLDMGFFKCTCRHGKFDLTAEKDETKPHFEVTTTVSCRGCGQRAVIEKRGSGIHIKSQKGEGRIEIVEPSG